MFSMPGFGEGTKRQHLKNISKTLPKHFDFFRIEHPDELDYIGLEEYFSVDTLSLIEWPDRGKGSLPKDDLTISVDFHNEKRLIQMNANSDLGEKVCSKVKRIA